MEKTIKKRNVAPVDYMFERKRIDAAQKKAADKFLKNWLILMASAGCASRDYSRPFVDGGKISGINAKALQSRLDIQKEMSKIKEILGVNGYELVETVVCKEIMISRIAKNQRRQNYLAERFYECLDCLAGYWSFFDRSSIVR